MVLRPVSDALTPPPPPPSVHIFVPLRGSLTCKVPVHLHVLALFVQECSLCSFVRCYFSKYAKNPRLCCLYFIFYFSLIHCVFFVLHRFQRLVGLYIRIIGLQYFAFVPVSNLHHSVQCYKTGRHLPSGHYCPIVFTDTHYNRHNTVAHLQ